MAIQMPIAMIIKKIGAIEGTTYSRKLGKIISDIKLNKTVRKSVMLMINDCFLNLGLNVLFPQK